ASPDLARASSLLAMVPLTPGFLLGLPIGIWTLAVLGEPRNAAGSDGLKPTPDDLNASALPGDNPV
ncbi:hypothetical protein ACYOEI_35655, partial [Singulisphaera rosea]